MKSFLSLVFSITLVISAWLQAQSGLEFDCAIIKEIPPSECEALVALYNSTGGENWRDRFGWLVYYSPSLWYGVQVSEGHVTSVVLEENNLVGSLPPELSHLTWIRYLILDGNQLSGSVPAMVSQIPSLHYLGMRDNQLTGSIPPELATLPNLQTLDLGHNQLSGSIPPTLGNFALLEYLRLDYNQLAGNIPPELGDISSLVILDLEYNQLSGSIPPELIGMTSLNGLYLYNNALTGSIPPALGGMPGLKWLVLDNNHLDGNLPPELGDLSGLETLSVGNNQLTGTIPTELGSLASLLVLDLSGNQLRGSIPPELGDLTTLYFLRLAENRLTGDIPEALANLVNLVDPGTDGEGEPGLALEYNMLNIPPGYPIPGNPLHDFLLQKDPGWELYQGFEQAVGPEGGQISAHDGKSALFIPAGALDGSVTFTYMPQPYPRHENLHYVPIHNSFELAAVDEVGDPFTSFNLPITVTLSYTQADIGAIPEDTLRLDYWASTSNQWLDAATTCQGREYTRNPDANHLSLPLCHLTEFAMFGQPLRMFLPVVTR